MSCCAVASILARGLPIAAVHSEDGPGQYELDIGLLAPLAFADAVVTPKTCCGARRAATDSR